MNMLNSFHKLALNPNWCYLGKSPASFDLAKGNSEEDQTTISVQWLFFHVESDSVTNYDYMK